MVKVFAYFLDLPNDHISLPILDQCIWIAGDVVTELLAQPMLPIGWGTYIATLNSLPIGPHDTVIVDEAQDLNSNQIQLLSLLVRQGSGKRAQLVAVGDDRQSIYRFRGARADAMPILAEVFSCVETKLMASQRCSIAVTRHASELVPDFETASEEQGHVATMPFDGSCVLWQPGDLVLCRNAAPLFALAVEAALMGRAATLPQAAVKRAIGTMEKITRRLKNYTLAELADRRQVENIKAALSWGDDGSSDIEDDAQTASALARAVIINGEHSIEGAIQWVRSTFPENGSGSGGAGADHGAGRRPIRFATIHSVKGLEADTVFIVDRWRMPSQMAVSDEARRQEENLEYVARTRARRMLAYVQVSDP